MRNDAIHRAVAPNSSRTENSLGAPGLEARPRIKGAANNCAGFTLSELSLADFLNFVSDEMKLDMLSPELSRQLSVGLSEVEKVANLLPKHSKEKNAECGMTVIPHSAFRAQRSSHVTPSQ